MRQYPNPKAPEGADWFTRVSAKWGAEILIVGGTAAIWAANILYGLIT